MIIVENNSVANILANAFTDKCALEPDQFKSFCENNLDDPTIKQLTDLSIEYIIRSKILSGQHLEKHWDYLSSKYPLALVDRYTNFPKELTDKHPEFVAKYINHFIFKNDCHISFVKWLCINKQWKALRCVTDYQVFTKSVKHYIATKLSENNRQSAIFSGFVDRIDDNIIVILEDDLATIRKQKESWFVYDELLILIVDKNYSNYDDVLQGDWCSISQFHYEVKCKNDERWYACWYDMVNKLKLYKFDDLDFDITFGGKLEFVNK